MNKDKIVSLVDKPPIGKEISENTESVIDFFDKCREAAKEEGFSSCVVLMVNDEKESVRGWSCHHDYKYVAGLVENIAFELRMEAYQDDQGL